MATEQEILASRRARAERLRERGVELFPARVPRDRTPIPEILARFGDADAAALAAAAASFCVAGRIVALRSYGKMAFATLQGDGLGLQVWLKKDALGESVWETVRLYEVSDFIYARGTPRAERTFAMALPPCEAWCRREREFASIPIPG